MGAKYNFIKKYFLNNNPVLTAFLIMFTAIISSYSLKIGFFISIILTLTLIVTKMFFLITSKYLKRNMALNLNILCVSTYVTLLFIISNILYMNQIKILIPASIILIFGNILNDRLGVKNENDKLVFCLLDGFIFFLISFIYMSTINIISSVFLILSTANLSILYFALSTLLINFFRIKIEFLLEKKDI